VVDITNFITLYFPTFEEYQTGRNPWGYSFSSWDIEMWWGNNFPSGFIFHKDSPQEKDSELDLMK